MGRSILQPLRASWEDGEMQVRSFWRLYARLISLRWSAREGVFPRGEATEASASQALVFTAIVLFLILAIVQIDLHRDELRALGFLSSEEGIKASFLSP